jgi:hypothetical protein
MYVENIKSLGILNIVLRDENGNIKEEREVPNMVVNTGLAYIQERMRVGTPTAMSHMALGTSSTAVVRTQSTLVTELGGSRVTVTPSAATETSANDTVQYVASFPAGTGTGAITEAGIFNDASVGTMLSRTVFTVINKAAGDSLTITWKIIMAPGA